MFLEKERWLLRALWLSLDQPPTDWLYTCDITSAAEELRCDSHIDSSDCTVLKAAFIWTFYQTSFMNPWPLPLLIQDGNVVYVALYMSRVYLSRNAADLIIENDLLTVNKTVCLSNALQWARKNCAWLTYALACFLCVKDNRLWLEACMSNAPCSAELGFFKMHHFTYYITPNTKPAKLMLLFLFSIIGF